MSKKAPTPDFEQSLAELERLVTSMEKGDLSLEQSLAAFERGIQLTRLCQTALKDAEQKVQILTTTGGTSQIETFEASADQNDNAD